MFTGLGLVVGPVLHGWYAVLSALVPPAPAAAAAASPGPWLALRKLALDQFVFAPPFLAAILGGLALAEGAPPEAAASKLRSTWWPVVTANWTFWLPANFVNFRFVPPPLQARAPRGWVGWVGRRARATPRPPSPPPGAAAAAAAARARHASRARPPARAPPPPAPLSAWCAQVAFANAAGLAWNVILSAKSH